MFIWLLKRLPRNRVCRAVKNEQNPERCDHKAIRGTAYCGKHFPKTIWLMTVAAFVIGLFGKFSALLTFDFVKERFAPRPAFSAALYSRALSNSIIVVPTQKDTPVSIPLFAVTNIGRAAAERLFIRVSAEPHFSFRANSPPWHNDSPGNSWITLSTEMDRSLYPGDWITIGGIKFYPTNGLPCVARFGLTLKAAKVPPYFVEFPMVFIQGGGLPFATNAYPPLQ